MPKIKQLEQCKHPNSRKTKALAKQITKQKTRQKLKLATNIKQNLIGEKLLWFKDNLDQDKESCSAEDVEILILKYLGRFDEELEQIKLKHSIGQRKNRQHANREDIINMTLKQEKEEFKISGIEMPDLLNQAQLKLLKNWTGELRFLQNFKFRRFSLQNLKAEKVKEENRKNIQNSEKSIESSNSKEIVAKNKKTSNAEESMEIDK